MKKFATGFVIVILLVITFGGAALIFKAYKEGKDDSAPQIECVHKYLDGNVIKEATCVEAGEMVFACTECGEAKTEYISALGHNLRYATSDDGHDEFCTRCDFERTVLNADVEISGYSSEEDTHTALCACGYKILEAAHEAGEWRYDENGNHVKSCVCGKEMEFLLLKNDKVLTINLNISSLDEETEATFAMLEILDTEIVNQNIAPYADAEGVPAFLEYNGQNVILDYLVGEDEENGSPIFSAKMFGNKLGEHRLDFLVVSEDEAVHRIAVKIIVVNDATATI